MKRILHFYSRFYPKPGGVESYISTIIKNMQNYKFEIITDSLQGYPLSEFYEKNAVIKRFLPYDYSLSGLNNQTINKIVFV